MKKIGIYPGNFQPATRAHLEVYKRLKSIVGPDSFIATTDREPTPDAPLNFGDKEQIWVRHGVPASNIVKISTLPIDDVGRAPEWKPREVFANFSAEHTIAICVFNEKEVALFSKRKGKTNVSNSGMSAATQMDVQKVLKELMGTEKGSAETWLKPNRSLQYFQPYKGNENNLKPLQEHAYVIVLDDSRIQGNPISTTNIRNVLGSSRYNDDQKKKFFRWIFGWFDIGLYQVMVSKFRMARQVASPEIEPSQPSIMSQQPTPISHSQQRKLEELVYEILRETMDEDYSTTINDPSSTTDNLTGGMDGNGNESPAQQKADASKNKQSLVKKKQKAERDLQGLQTDLKWKQSDILRKRKDELPNKRKELDDLNKQIAAASSTTSVSSS
jgi:hypothetical protein